MEVDVKHSKQRNKRRERAQRMQAERDKDAVDGVGIADSADEDSKKPIRPPQRRKKANIFKEPSPILEEDVVDGFAILSFKTYEDLEVRNWSFFRVWIHNLFQPWYIHLVLNINVNVSP